MLEYLIQKGNEMIADSLRAVTGWDGPIVPGKDRFIFLKTDGIPAFEAKREHALHVHEKVQAKGGTHRVIRELENRSMLNILAKWIPQGPLSHPVSRQSNGSK